MADRQRFCVIILSLMILGSGCYLGYNIFIDSNKDIIDKLSWMRLCIFFAQHIITLAMLVRLLYYEETDNVIVWMFQLSLIVILTFISGQIFAAVRGGKIFGSSLFFFQLATHNKQNPVLQFQINQITLYYQIMTDFIMFFIVSAIAMIVIKCRSMEEENRYEFMIDNLKSQDYVDESNLHDKKTCAICLTDLSNQRVLKVPCEHIFHKECLVNWLKRSTICPLCRTDIQQSLSPNSPLRVPYDNSPVVAVPIHTQPYQQIPELSFVNNRPTVSVGIQSNRGNFTDRVNQEVSNTNSRVSISRAIRQRNILAQRRNNQTIRNQSNPQFQQNLSPPNNLQERINRNPYNLLTARSYQQKSRKRLNIDVENQQQNPLRMNAPLSQYSNTPRSIYLPPPESQNLIKLKVNQSTNPLSQPLIKVHKQTQQKRQHQLVPSQEKISSIPKNYSNPNQKFIRNTTFKTTKHTQIQTNNKKTFNQIYRQQII